VVLISGSIADSAAQRASGRIEFAQAQRMDTGELLVTQTVATAQVVGGELRALDGSAFSLPANPEGTAVRVRELLGGRTFEWWTAVPEVEAVEYRMLEPVESSSVPASVFGPPPWLAEARQMRDDTVQAIADGAAVADALGGLAGITQAVADAQAAATASGASVVQAEQAVTDAAAEANRAEAAADSIDMTAINTRLDGMDTSIAAKPSTAEVTTAIASGVAPKADTAYVDRRFTDGDALAVDARLLAGLRSGRTVWVFAGSSTTSMGDYYAAFMGQLESRWRTGIRCTLAEAASETFGTGLHSVNAGVSATSSANYLGSGRAAAISALNTSVVVHSIGAADWKTEVPPATYKSNLESAISSLSSNVPLVHIIMHQHERINAPDTWTWAEYGQAAREVAAAQPNRIFVDVSQDMRRAGVGVGLDNRYGLLSNDDTHLTPEGAGVLAEAVAQRLGVVGVMSTGWVDLSQYLTGAASLHASGKVEAKRTGDVVTINAYRVLATYAANASVDILSGIPEIFRPGIAEHQSWGVAWGATAGNRSGFITSRSPGTVGIQFEAAQTEARASLTYHA